MGMLRTRSRDRTISRFGGRQDFKVGLITMVLMMVLSITVHAKTLHIVAFGDSLTAGYNLDSTADFPSQLEAVLKKAGRDVRITNAGVSGDTTSGGVARFDWAVPQQVDAVILELGANDALRGVSPKIARDNLETLIEKLKARRIPVLLAGMRAPANWGADYVVQFNAIYPELADKHNILLYPFFMEGVIDRPDLKLSDALHPNRQGVAEIVKRILPDVLKLLDQAKAQAKRQS